MSRHLTLSKALTAVLLFIGIAFGQNAFAQTSWSVSKDSESDIVAPDTTPGMMSGKVTYLKVLNGW